MSRDHLIVDDIPRVDLMAGWLALASPSELAHWRKLATSGTRGLQVLQRASSALSARPQAPGPARFKPGLLRVVYRIIPALPRQLGRTFYCRVMVETGAVVLMQRDLDGSGARDFAGPCTCALLSTVASIGIPSCTYATAEGGGKVLSAKG